MSEKINWTLNVQVVGGPRISASQMIPIEAYDKIDVIIPQKGEAGSGSLTVEIQPGSIAGQVQFLLISANKYDAKVSYKVNKEAAPDIKLDALQLFMGSGAVSLLDKDNAPGKLIFSNGLEDDIPVQILVGRDATP